MAWSFGEPQGSCLAAQEGVDRFEGPRQHLRVDHRVVAQGLPLMQEAATTGGAHISMSVFFYK